MTTPSRPDNALGTFLRDRRTKLDPAKFDVPMSRRRTEGLRREEVAQRADISSTYYTWIEQGRGATPSADVLERLARALALTAPERDHLFVLAQNRPRPSTRRPCPRSRPRSSACSPHSGLSGVRTHR